MSELYATVIFLFVLFALLGGSVWIGLALMGVAWVGMELFTMRPAGDAMITTIWSGASSWTLTALPLFIWMGEILYRTRLSEDMFRGLAPWMRYLPGGLLHTNIAGCTIFAAVSGSSAATLNMVGKMSIPELRERGYPEFMIIGTLAGAATLGLMIPPSLTLIVYGVTINESITKLFMAGVFPGLVLAGLFMLYIIAWHYLYPDQRPEPEPKMSFSKRMAESRFLLPLFGLVFIVIGSMYSGYATATEAAAVGVFGALVLSAVQGSLDWNTFKQALMGATKTSAMIAFILMGAAFLSLSMGFTGLPRALAGLIDSYNLSPVALIAVLTLFYLVLGMFMDQLSMMLLTVPIFFPLASQLGFDLIWFGVIVLLALEISFTTPPFGLLLFVMKGVAPPDTKMTEIYMAGIPFILCAIAVVILMVIFPDVALYLPNLVK